MSDVQILTQDEVVSLAVLTEHVSVSMQSPEKMFIVMESQSPVFVEVQQGEQEPPSVVNIENNPITIELTSPEYLNLILQEASFVIAHLLEEPAPSIVYVKEQGPPGIPGKTLAFEKSDSWILSGSLNQVALSKVPRADTIKFFHNGLKQDSSLLEIIGAIIQLDEELANNLFMGDRVEVVYNYED